MIIPPIKNPEPFARTNVTVRNRVTLLHWGSSGCGKSLLGKATANTSKANFISVWGQELPKLNKVPTLIPIPHNLKLPTNQHITLENQS